MFWLLLLVQRVEVDKPFLSPDFWSSLINVEFIMKVAIVLAAYPLWGPIMRAFRREIQDALAPDGGLTGLGDRQEVAQRPPGLDPWISIPLASKRGQAPNQKAAGQRSGAPRQPRNEPARGQKSFSSPRRRGF